jgi:hypothetical protein
VAALPGAPGLKAAQDPWSSRTFRTLSPRFARPGPTYETQLVRSRDLSRWESSPLNPVLAHSDEDKVIASPSLDERRRREIARAVDISNSDMDLCEFRGKTVISYTWGKQQASEFLAGVEYDGSLEDSLKDFSPAR